LRQGLSPCFKYNDAMANISATTNSRTASYGRVRSVSLMPDASGPSLVRACRSTSESSHSTLSAVGGKIQRTSTNGATPTASSPQLDRLNVPKRSASAGIAFMQRVAARKAGTRYRPKWWRRRKCLTHSETCCDRECNYYNTAFS
jgi:hypothetical protein